MTDKQHRNLQFHAASHKLGTGRFHSRTEAHQLQKTESRRAITPAGLHFQGLFFISPQNSHQQEYHLSKKKKKKEKLTNSGLQEMLVTLARFTRLRTLELPAPANLGFVVPAGRMCGTPMGWKQERAMTRQYFKDIDRVASLTVEFVPWLEELRVDRREAAIAHDQDGGASAAWPWSGRLEEHLEDIMPDYKRS